MPPSVQTNIFADVGMPLAAAAQSAATEAAATMPASTREGRYSNAIARADFIDDALPARLGRRVAAAEPNPKIGVLLFEQSGKCRLLRVVGAAVARVEIPAEQLVEFAHAAAAAPAQASLLAHRKRPNASAAQRIHSVKPPARYA